MELNEPKINEYIMRRNFFYELTRYIFDDTNLTSKEKLLMIFFLQKSDNQGYVIATNEEISKATNFSKRMASDYVKSLIQKGYLDYVKFNGKARILQISQK